jgi:hypothetical protein
VKQGLLRGCGDPKEKKPQKREAIGKRGDLRARVGV